MANVTVEQAAINHESLSTISPMLSDRNGDLRQTGEKRITSQEEKSTCNDNPGLKDFEEGDTDDPKNWSLWRKWSIIFTVAAMHMLA